MKWLSKGLSMKTKQFIVALFLCGLLLGTNTITANPAPANKAVLLWLVLEQNDTQEFLAGDLYQSQINQLMISAQAYGLNILLPMFDLSERLLIHEQDIAGFKWETLLPASERYKSTTIVAGRLRQQNGAWICEWQLYDPVQPQTWVVTGNDLNEQFVMVTERLASQLHVAPAKTAVAQTAANKDHVKIRVKGIDSLEAYSTVLEYLGKIATVQLDGLHGDEALFSLSTDLDKYSVAQAIAGDSVLVTDLNPTANNSEYLDYKVHS
jgi:hypothetical protein